MSSTLFNSGVGSFKFPQKLDKCKCCEMGPTVFRPYPRRLESLAIGRRHYKGSTFFLLSYLKTMGVGQAGVRTRDLPFTRPFSPN